MRKNIVYNINLPGIDDVYQVFTILKDNAQSMSSTYFEKLPTSFVVYYADANNEILVDTYGKLFFGVPGWKPLINIKYKQNVGDFLLSLDENWLRANYYGLTEEELLTKLEEILKETYVDYQKIET